MVIILPSFWLITPQIEGQNPEQISMDQKCGKLDFYLWDIMVKEEREEREQSLFRVSKRQKPIWLSL